MDIGGFLFGKEPEVKTGREDVWADWQKQLGERMGGEMQELPWQATPYEGKLPGQTPIAGAQPYGGALPGSASLSSLEELSITGLEGMIGEGGLGRQVQESIASMLDPTGEFNVPGAEKFTPEFGEGAPGYEDWYQKTIYDPTMEQFEEETIPGIRAVYAPSGYWSSERVGSEEQAREDVLEKLVRGRSEGAFRAAELGLGGFRAGTERQATAAQVMSPKLEARRQALIAAGLLPGTVGAYGAATEVGAVPRGVEEGKIAGEYGEWQRRTGVEQGRTELGEQSEYAEFLRQQGVPADMVAMYVQALGLKPFEPYAVGQEGQPGLVQTGVSSFLGGLGGTF